jgi:hypothetical protein
MTHDDVSGLETSTVADISNIAFFPPSFMNLFGKSKLPKTDLYCDSWSFRGRVVKDSILLEYDRSHLGKQFPTFLRNAALDL